MSDSFSASIDDFLDFMPETVQINTYASISVSGVVTYSATATSYPARIEMKNHLIVDRTGRTVVARGRIFLGTTTVPDIKDKVTLPSQYSIRTPPIIDVNPCDDESGVHHVTLEIG